MVKVRSDFLVLMRIILLCLTTVRCIFVDVMERRKTRFFSLKNQACLPASLTFPIYPISPLIPGVFDQQHEFNQGESQLGHLGTSYHFDSGTEFSALSFFPGPASSGYPWSPPSSGCSAPSHLVLQTPSSKSPHLVWKRINRSLLSSPDSQ